MPDQNVNANDARYNELKSRKDEGSLKGAEAEEFERLEKDQKNRGTLTTNQK